MATAKSERLKECKEKRQKKGERKADRPAEIQTQQSKVVHLSIQQCLGVGAADLW